MTQGSSKFSSTLWSILSVFFFFFFFFELQYLHLEIVETDFLTTTCWYEHLPCAGWGRIINIASSHGLVASPNKSAYVASKFGLVGLTKVYVHTNETLSRVHNDVVWSCLIPRPHGVRKKWPGYEVTMICSLVPRPSITTNVVEGLVFLYNVYHNITHSASFSHR